MTKSLLNNSGTHLSNAHDAFAILLAQNNWQTFCTFTYQVPIWAVEKIQRDLKWTIRKATALTLDLNPNSKSFKKNWLKGLYAPWFIAIETHKSGSLHAHALVGTNAEHSDSVHLKTINNEHIKTAFNDCNNSGFTKIEPCRKNNSAVNYMIKSSRYCTKSDNSVLDWNGLKGWE